MTIEKIMVIGSGQMGSGIVQVAAQAGYNVYLFVRSEASMKRALGVIENNLDRSVSKGRISEEEKKIVQDRIKCVFEIETAKECDLVIEAIVEDMGIKQDLFRNLEDICGTDTIFASNTSSLPITEIASATKRPDKFIGMHFMQPVPVMTLVELIRGLATSDDTFNIIKEVSEKMGKYVVAVRDVPGFVSNRVLQIMINEAIYCVNEGVATPEGIDEVMKRGMNHKMGPLELADFIGLDTVLSIMEVMYKGYGDSKYRPCPLLKQYVAAGWLGRKSGRGFYEYS